MHDARSSSAAAHLRDILTLIFEHPLEAPALVVYDARCELARLLEQAYRAALPNGRFVPFDESTPEAVMLAFEQLERGALVVLVESSSFRLDAFRIRVELFNRGMKVIEHPHLDAMTGPEIDLYVESLAYDPAYYRTLGEALRARIDAARSGEVDSDGVTLRYESAFEPAKLNTGDYSSLQHKGGQFPIGEVFTEAVDLERVNGRARIYAFADIDFHLDVPAAPIELVIERGRVTDVIGSTPAFDEVIHQITSTEGEVWVRELGLGMNRAFSRERLVSDVGTYERVCGVHLSIGGKHNVYKKAGFSRKDLRAHVDVFVVTDQVRLDDRVIYRDGAWCP